MEFPQEVPAPKEQHVNFSYSQAPCKATGSYFGGMGFLSYRNDCENSLKTSL